MTLRPSKTPSYQRRYAKLYRSGYRVLRDALPYRRRLQALQVIGYPIRVVHERMRPDTVTFRYLQAIMEGKRAKIHWQIANEIARVYDECCMHPRQGTSAKRVATAARRKGWAGPLAWEDIDTDDEPVGMEEDE